MTTVTAGLAPVRRVLANGAVVIAQEATFSPSVTISAAFRAGTLYEPDDLPGLASLLGRVIDRGTANRTADELAEALDDRGVTMKVFTNRHVVTLACTCLIDENVHFRHTARLINALIDARKSYDLLLFPDERHSPRHVEERVYLEERIRDYFLQNL